MREEFVVESYRCIDKRNKQVTAQFRAIMPGHPHFTPGAISLDWCDPGAYLNVNILLKDEMPVTEVRAESRLISGNGECSKRPMPEQMTNDVEELLCVDGRVNFSLFNEEVAEVMVRRWDEREVAWGIRLAFLHTDIQFERALEIFQEIVAIEKVMKS